MPIEGRAPENEISPQLTASLSSTARRTRCSAAGCDPHHDGDVYRSGSMGRYGAGQSRLIRSTIMKQPTDMRIFAAERSEADAMPVM